MALVLTLKSHEIVSIGDVVICVRKNGSGHQLVIEAPRTMKIYRVPSYICESLGRIEQITAADIKKALEQNNEI